MPTMKLADLPYYLGRVAHRDGCFLMANPYAEEEKAEEWERGWMGGYLAKRRGIAAEEPQPVGQIEVYPGKEKWNGRE